MRVASEWSLFPGLIGPVIMVYLDFIRKTLDGSWLRASDPRLRQSFGAAWWTGREVACPGAAAWTLLPHYIHPAKITERYVG